MIKNISIATGSLSAIPLMHHLAGNGYSVRVIIPREYEQMEVIFRNQNTDTPIEFFGDDALYNESLPADLIITMGYPKKVDTKKLPSCKAVNIHFGPLPENRGADPLFWTLKQGRKLAYITIHELSEQIDGGAVLLEKAFEIYPGENYGLLTSRLGTLTPSLVRQVMDETPEAVPQNEKDAITYPKPSQNDLIINWQEMSAEEIENLVNASNPVYNGAVTAIDGTELRILEVSPAEINRPPESERQEPGTVVLASAGDGLFVQCRDDQFLRLNVLSTNVAILSGQKLAALGVSAGARFKTPGS